MVLQPLEQLPAAELARPEVEVEQQHVRPAPGDLGDVARRLSHRAQLVAERNEDVAEQLPDVGVVLDDEHLPSGHVRPVRKSDADALPMIARSLGTYTGAASCAARRMHQRGVMRLRHRTTRRELLDGEALDPREVAANLRDFARLNRLPGGVRASLAAVDRLADGAGELSILDVGTGGADIPLRLAAEGRRRGARWRIMALERHPQVLAQARARVRSRRDPDVELVEGDALRLPLADRSVDVAHASLLLHHLEPDAARRALREMARVARRGVIVNDLQRGLIPLAMTAAVTLALARSRYARHDGIVSAERAYRLSELDALLADAGLRVAWRSTALLPRVTTAAVAASVG